MGIDPSGKMTLVSLTASAGIRGIIAGLVFASISTVFDIAKGNVSGINIFYHAIRNFGIGVLTFMSAPFAIAVTSAGLFAIAIKAFTELSGLQKTSASDWLEIASYIVVALALAYFFKSAGLYEPTLTSSQQAELFNQNSAMNPKNSGATIIKPQQVSMKMLTELSQNDPIEPGIEYSYQYMAEPKIWLLVRGTPKEMLSPNVEGSVGLEPGFEFYAHTHNQITPTFSSMRVDIKSMSNGSVEFVVGKGDTVKIIKTKSGFPVIRFAKGSKK